jgi:ribosomal protein S27AE
MPTQDTKLVIRCPYCVLGLDFRPMAAHKDGRFVCEKCGHTVHPEETAYLCSCCRCLRLKDAAAWLEERWLQ